MADENSSPRPFRRERNLSNRNFNKRGSNRRRFSTESHSSIESKSLNDSLAKEHIPVESKNLNSTPTNEQITLKSKSLNNSPATEDNASGSNQTTRSTYPPTLSTPLDLSSITFDLTFSTDSNTDDTLYSRSELRTQVLDININNDEDNRHSAGISHSARKVLQRQNSMSPQTSPSPLTPDPALLDVKQKLLIFENLKHEKTLNLKTSKKYKSKSTQSLLESERIASASPLLQLPSSAKDGSMFVNVYATIRSPTSMVFKNVSIEEHSEDEVESLKDEINEEYVRQVQDEFGQSTSNGGAKSKENITPVAAINKSFLTPVFQHSKSHDAREISPETKQSPVVDENDGIVSITDSTPMTQKTRNKDFPR